MAKSVRPFKSKLSQSILFCTWTKLILFYFLLDSSIKFMCLSRHPCAFSSFLLQLLLHFDLFLLIHFAQVSRHILAVMVLFVCVLFMTSSKWMEEVFVDAGQTRSSLGGRFGK